MAPGPTWRSLAGSLLLGAGFLSVGLMLLGVYLRDGAISVPKENMTLTGRGALTVPAAMIGGGGAIVVWSAAVALRARRRP
jgi:hypothetical protein